jgi:tetrahydromethanopterin S-methyltransferase subunit C
MATKDLCHAGQISTKKFYDCAIITAFIAGFSISYRMALLEFFKAFLDHSIVHAKTLSVFSKMTGLFVPRGNERFRMLIIVNAKDITSYVFKRTG